LSETFVLERIADPHARSETGRVRGKPVITL